MDVTESARRSIISGHEPGLNIWQQTSIPWSSDDDGDGHHFHQSVQEQPFPAFAANLRSLGHIHSSSSPPSPTPVDSSHSPEASLSEGHSTHQSQNSSLSSTRASVSTTSPIDSSRSENISHGDSEDPEDTASAGNLFMSSIDTAQSISNSVYVDLTTDTPAMAPSKRSHEKRKDASRDETTPIEADSRPPKRRRTKKQDSSIEEIDLRDIEYDSDLARVLERQRTTTVREQQEQADKPTKLSKVTCVVCMEELTNMTATHCGHLFCHTCLMEALIAGENQGGKPGKGLSKCPICRKKVKRPKGQKDTSNVISLEIKVATRGINGKGKAKA